MLSLFRTNQLPTAILFLLYALLLRLPGIFMPELRPDLPEDTELWSHSFILWLEQSFWWEEIFVIFLLAGQATLLSILVIENRIGREVSLFPGIFYLLIVSSNPVFIPLSGILLANTFCIFSLWEMLKTYRVPSCADTIFNVGLWIGVASLFYFSYCWLIVWAIISLNSMRAFKLKELLMVLLGFLTPYALLGAWYFWTDQWPEFVSANWSESPGFFDFNFYGILNEYLTIGLMVVLLLMAIASSRQYFIKQNIQIQKKISVIYWMLGFLALGIFFHANANVHHLLMVTVPLSIFISLNFQNIESKWAESTHLIWFALAILIQFLPLIV